jgi:predicted alpha/beta superfamily hydrolase
MLVSTAALCHPAQVQEAGQEINLTVGRAFTIHSETLGEDRQVLVSLPRGYDEGKNRYPVLIVLDGSPMTLFLAQASLFDRKLPQFVIAAVPNVDRLRDMSHRSIPEIWPTSGGSERFLGFLTDELVPILDSRFRTTRYRVIHGGSAAGRFAMYAMFKRPDIFYATLARSPVIGTDFEMFHDLLKELAEVNSRDEHYLHIVYGSHDYPVVTGYVDRFVALLEDQAPPWLRFSSQVVDGKGHFQYAGLNAGLSALFEDHEFPVERYLSEGPSAVSRLVAILAERYGSQVDSRAITGERAIIDVANNLGRQRRFYDAIRVLDYGLEKHPASAPVTYYKAQMLELAGNDKQARLTYQKVFELEPSIGIAGMTRIFLDNMAARGGEKPSANQDKTSSKPKP